MLTARAASAGQEHGSDRPIYKTSPRLRLGEGEREGCRRGPVVCSLHKRSKGFAGDSSMQPRGSVPGKMECWKARLGNSWAQDLNGCSRAVFLLDSSFLFPQVCLLSSSLLLCSWYSDVSCETPFRLMDERQFPCIIFRKTQ